MTAMGEALLIGLLVWCALDPSVVVEFVHSLVCRCLDLEDDTPAREHERAMAALEKASRR